MTERLAFYGCLGIGLLVGYIESAPLFTIAVCLGTAAAFACSKDDT